MAIELTNKATLNFNSGAEPMEVSSNPATISMEGPMSVYKKSLETGYRMDDILTYSIIVKNTSDALLENLVITDNLGTYELPSTVTVAPLTYVGPANEYLNTVFVSEITGTVAADEKSVNFSIASLAAGSSILIQYKVRTNEYAKGEAGSTIINTISVIAKDINNPTTTSHTIPVATYADLLMRKTMEPASIKDGDTIIYDFIIENYGTDAATDVIFTDAFPTTTSIDEVKLDNVIIGTDKYDFNNNIFTYPGAASGVELSIPGARFVQSEDGVVTIVPHKSHLVITGTV